ncbi:hypothetical protein BC831DRAFT_274847 [Entophlyctis helioformis]|nr:hypothetical protein BC831DRAFT_274847 [Entophlyctis helioformis]
MVVCGIGMAHTVLARARSKQHGTAQTHTPTTCPRARSAAAYLLQTQGENGRRRQVTSRNRETRSTGPRKRAKEPKHETRQRRWIQGKGQVNADDFKSPRWAGRQPTQTVTQ